MTTPRVSVVLPAFNRADVVERAIHSVLRQSYRDLELIVVDDGSTDATSGRAAAIDDARMRVIRRARGGPGAARNSGIAHARGDLIAFQDSDDEWLPDKLERQVSALDLDPGIGLMVCGYREATPAGPIDFPPPLGPEGPLPALLQGRNYITPTWLLRRPALERAGVFDESLPSCEDYDLALRLSDVCRFGAVPDLLVVKHGTCGSVYGDARSRAEGRRRAYEKHRHRWRGHAGWQAEQETVVGLLLLRNRQVAGLRYLVRALRRDPIAQLGGWWNRVARRLGRSRP